MLLALSLALAAAGPPYLNGGIGRAQDDPNVVLRVLPGGPASPVPSAPTLAGSFGEALSFSRPTAANCQVGSGTIYPLASGVPCITEQGYRADPLAVNLLLRNTDLGNAAAWSAGGVTCAAPSVVSNSTDLTDPFPFGTNTASKVTFPACSAGGSVSAVAQVYTATAAAYSSSIYARTLSGTYAYNLVSTQSGADGSFVNCTANSTSWTRCVLPNVTETVAGWSFKVGFEGRGAGSTAIGAGTVYFSLAQAELGSSVTSAIGPTLASTVQRNGESSSAARPSTLTTAEGCVSVDVTSPPLSGNPGNNRLIGFDTSNSGLMYNSSLTSISIWDNATFTTSLNGVSLSGRTAHVSGWWSTALNQKVACLDGACSAPGTYSNHIADGPNINIGHLGGVSQGQATYANLVVGSSRFACPQ